MAEIHYRTPIDPDVTVTFDKFADLERIIERANIERHTNWHEIENVTITLNRSTQRPRREIAK